MPPGSRFACPKELGKALAFDDTRDAAHPPAADPASRISTQSDIHIYPPFPLSSVSYPAFVPRLFGKHYTVQQGGAVSWTYLDSTGRPTVVLTKEGCTDMHGGDVLVRAGRFAISVVSSERSAHAV